MSNQILDYTGSVSDVNAVEYGTFFMSANQTTNITTGNHIQFDTTSGSGTITVSTGAGQASGLISLLANVTYVIKLQGLVSFLSPSSGVMGIRIYNETAGTSLSVPAYFVPVAESLSDNQVAMCSVIYTPTANVQISARIDTSTNVSIINSTYTSMHINSIQKTVPVKILTTDVSYSTTEQDTGGTWIDSKPVYRKAVNFGALPNATTKTVAHGISTIDNVVKMHMIITNGSSYRYIDDSYLYVDGTNIGITTISDFSTYAGVGIIEYTKV